MTPKCRPDRSKVWKKHRVLARAPINRAAEEAPRSGAWTPTVEQLREGFKYEDVRRSVLGILADMPIEDSCRLFARVVRENERDLDIPWEERLLV